MNCKNCKRQGCSFAGKSHEMSFECRLYVGKTNADRIRGMTDEELAEHFTQFYYDGPKFYCPAVEDVGEGACAANYDCRQCWIDWLKKESE